MKENIIQFSSETLAYYNLIRNFATHLSITIAFASSGFWEGRERSVLIIIYPIKNFTIFESLKYFHIKYFKDSNMHKPLLSP